MYRNLSVTSLCLIYALAACSEPGEDPPVDAAPADVAAEGSQGRVIFLDESPLLPPPRGYRPGPPSLYPPAPVVLFLNFDGATVTQAPASSAAANTSPLCGGVMPAFDHKPHGADRATVVSQIKARVAALLKDFDVTLVTARPKTGPYEMALIGGLPTLCGYGPGIGGLAPLDCNNASRGDLYFVFSAGITHLDMLAIAIGHELGHTFGLPHSAEGCDVMSSLFCPGLKKVYMNKQMQIWPDHKGKCGLAYTNSWQMMYDVLGKAP